MLLQALPDPSRARKDAFLLKKAFEIAGYGKDEVEKRFGGMVNAFQYFCS